MPCETPLKEWEKARTQGYSSTDLFRKWEHLAEFHARRLRVPPYVTYDDVHWIALQYLAHAVKTCNDEEAFLSYANRVIYNGLVTTLRLWVKEARNRGIVGAHLQGETWKVVSFKHDLGYHQPEQKETPHLREATRTLDLEEYKIIWLHYNGWSFARISRALGIPTTTLFKLKNRALEKLNNVITASSRP